MGADNKLKDMTGAIIKGWEAYKYVGKGYWECRCTTCGKIKKFIGRDFRHHKIGECKHKDKKECAKESKTTRKDLKGKRVNDWLFIEYAGNGKWKCQCLNCNTVKDVDTQSILSGRSTNCGCKNQRTLVGRKFGALLVIQKLENNNYKCICECGNIHIVAGSNLLNGNIRSCGCRTTEFKRATMLDRYGETATSRINNPRSTECIEACLDKSKMIEMIEEVRQSICRIPSIEDLANRLDINTVHALNYIRQYNLESYIQKSIYGASEDELYDYIVSLGITRDRIIRHNRTTLGNMELDIYIPDSNLAFEFNGTYWHSSELKDKAYHQTKTIQCAKQGIRLIHIFEYEWSNSETQKKLKAFIKSIIDKKSNTVIYARNTSIVNIDTKDLREFLNNNHFQGYIASSINLGLTYNNELVEVMTFGKPRFSRLDIEYELLRLATKQSTIVIGGANKLFSSFIRDYKPNSIISYCDISKFTGNVYNTLGFSTDMQSITEPNYVWVHKHTNDILKRYQTMKHKLLQKGLGNYGNTESEIMHNLGYVRIYDSGNLRFIWNRKE